MEKINMLTYDMLKNFSTTNSTYRHTIYPFQKVPMTKTYKYTTYPQLSNKENQHTNIQYAQKSLHDKIKHRKI
jgi:hypothetical protein